LPTYPYHRKYDLSQNQTHVRVPSINFSDPFVHLTKIVPLNNINNMSITHTLIN